METLPVEKIWDIALRTDPTSLLEYCQTQKLYSALCSNENFWKDYFKHNPNNPEDVASPLFWARKAEYDFGFPRDAFPFVGKYESSARDRYMIIKDMVPLPENFLLLNQMAPQWDQYKDNWDLTLDYPMEPTLYPDKKLHTLEPMTEEQADQFLDTLSDRSEEEDFTKSNHLYINTVYSVTRAFDPIFKQRVNLDSNRRTLVRGYENNSVSYHDVLSNTRNLFPGDASGVIQYYSWKGFSEDGIPIIKVVIDFQF